MNSITIPAIAALTLGRPIYSDSPLLIKDSRGRRHSVHYSDIHDYAYLQHDGEYNIELPQSSPALLQMLVRAAGTKLDFGEIPTPQLGGSRLYIYAKAHVLGITFGLTPDFVLPEEKHRKIPTLTAPTNIAHAVAECVVWLARLKRLSMYCRLGDLVDNSWPKWDKIDNYPAWVISTPLGSRSWGGEPMLGISTKTSNSVVPKLLTAADASSALLAVERHLGLTTWSVVLDERETTN